MTDENKGVKLNISNPASVQFLSQLSLPETYSNIQYIIPHTKVDVVWAPVCRINIEDLKIFPESQRCREQKLDWLRRASLYTI